jgi:hypothetical protein
MPILPLSSGFSVIPQGGDLPVTDASDVIATLPSAMQPNQASPVRDALCAAIAGLMIRHQEEAGYAAAQCDILRATDQYLIALAEERGYFQQANETQEQFRARILATPAVVTPQAIVSLANALIAPYTNKQCMYFESALDRWFVNNGATWNSFVGVGPRYDDRLYVDPNVTDGTRVPNRDPGGAWVFADTNGRLFGLRVPVIQDSDVAIEYAGYNDATVQPILLFGGDAFHLPDAGPPELGGAETPAPALPGAPAGRTPQAGDLPSTAGGRGLFVANGTNTGGSEADGSCATFLYRGAIAALSIQQSIVNSIERIRGQGIRWLLFVDPNL